MESPIHEKRRRNGIENKYRENKVNVCLFVPQLRDFNLGDNFPVFMGISVDKSDVVADVIQVNLNSSTS